MTSGSTGPSWAPLVLGDVAFFWFCHGVKRSENVFTVDTGAPNPEDFFLFFPQPLEALLMFIGKAEHKTSSASTVLRVLTPSPLSLPFIPLGGNKTALT